MSNNIFGKAWVAMILLLVVAESVFLGSALKSKDWHGAIVNAILLAFWLFAIVWFHFMALREVRRDLEFKRDMDELKKKGDDLLKDLLSDVLDEKHKNHRHKVSVVTPENPKHEALSEAFDGIMEQVCGDNEPTEKNLAEIKRRFESITGHSVKIEQLPFGLSVSIAKEPTAKKAARKPATKKAPVKKPVAKKTVTKKGTK